MGSTKKYGAISGAMGPANPSNNNPVFSCICHASSFPNALFALQSLMPHCLSKGLLLDNSMCGDRQAYPPSRTCKKECQVRTCVNECHDPLGGCGCLSSHMIYSFCPLLKQCGKSGFGGLLKYYVSGRKVSIKVKKFGIL